MTENSGSAFVRPPGDQPADYLIHVRGWLDPNWFEFHQELTITAVAAPDHLPETTLRGMLADQSALIGVLSTLQHFGLTILLVQMIEPQTTKAASSPH